MDFNLKLSLISSTVISMELKKTKITCIMCFWIIDTPELSLTLSAFCPRAETPQEIETKGGGITDFVDEMSKQPNIQAVAQVLLAAFSQIYSDNQRIKMWKI